MTLINNKKIKDSKYLLQKSALTLTSKPIALTVKTDHTSENMNWTKEVVKKVYIDIMNSLKS